MHAVRLSSEPAVLASPLTCCAVVQDVVKQLGPLLDSAQLRGGPLQALGDGGRRLLEPPSLADLQLLCSGRNNNTEDYDSKPPIQHVALVQ